MGLFIIKHDKLAKFFGYFPDGFADVVAWLAEKYGLWGGMGYHYKRYGLRGVRLHQENIQKI